MSAAVTRGQLLELYGFENRWIRNERPVRVVDARADRNGTNHLAWVHENDGFNGAVRWITEKNFTRFYRPHLPAPTGPGTTET